MFSPTVYSSDMAAESMAESDWRTILDSLTDLTAQERNKAEALIALRIPSLPEQLSVVRGTIQEATDRVRSLLSLESEQGKLCDFLGTS